MTRYEIINAVGSEYLTTNIETGEFSYVKAAGTLAALEKKLEHKAEHYKLDIRFEAQDDYGKYVILIETKQNFNDNDEKQLAAYLEAERALFRGEKIICILANTNDDKIKVWFSEIDDEHFLRDEKVLETMEHYQKLFSMRGRNDRETVMKNTYALNESLHKFDIDEKLRSQFVGTCLLYVKNCINKKFPNRYITKNLADELINFWAMHTPKEIRSGIEAVLGSLLDGSENKDKKIELLQKNVLENQKVKALTCEEWLKILEDITLNIYRFIDADSSEGQDILNLFFITFNKYTGKADKNQAFTPDHITDFMAKLTEVDRTKRVLDECCGSGSFLVQAMVKELADCRRDKNEKEAKKLMDKVKKNNIFGIEFEEKAYGLATTNMLIHGDGNSNIILGSCFEKRDFIVKAKPHIILMNPPYNAKPKMIPPEYQKNWGKASDGKEDPTKGLVFVKYLSDIAKAEDWNGTKLAVLLPMSAAIGTSTIISDMKQALLEDNTLEAVFSLPAEIFYPGASVQACCMLFTLNKPHFDSDGKINKATFFGYYKDDGFKKKKNLGRVEQFNAEGRSKWKDIEERWLRMYRDKSVVAGLSAMQPVTGKDEWLCEAYMKTDYSKLTQGDFQRTINNYVSYLVKTSKIENADEAVNTENWKEFRVGDLFEIKRGLCSDASSLDNGNDIYYIGAKKDDNGIISKVAYDNSLISKGNCIACICDGAGSVGYATYQDKDFIGTVNLRLLYHKKLTTETALFIVPVLDCERAKYSFGRKWGTHLDDTVIKLPATSDGEPDWEFMERFMKKRYQKVTPPQTRVKTYKIPLNVHKWKEFRVGDLFEIINGKGITQEEIEEHIGAFEAIQSGSDNNAVIGLIDYDYCRSMNYSISDVPCLTVARTGTSGFVSYHQNGCVVGDSAKILHLRNDKHNNPYVLSFVQTILMTNMYKYSYGNKVNEEKYKSVIMKLPASPDGTPDWKFMENYIKSLPFSDKI